MDPNQTTQPVPEQTPTKATGANKYLQPYKSRGKIMLDNFLGGLAWSLGSLVGLVILTAASAYFISKIDLVPLIGSLVAQILQNATSQFQPPIR